MTARERQKLKVNFPLKQYLQQLFVADTDLKFINPFSFWRRYRINHLETCWAINPVQHLERCYQIEWKPLPSQAETVMNSSLPWEKTIQNTLLISQSSFELKYHGVTYRTTD